MRGPKRREYSVEAKIILDKPKQARKFLFEVIEIGERNQNSLEPTHLKQGVVGFLRATV